MSDCVPLRLGGSHMALAPGVSRHRDRERQRVGETKTGTERERERERWREEKKCLFPSFCLSVAVIYDGL